VNTADQTNEPDYGASSGHVFRYSAPEPATSGIASGIVPRQPQPDASAGQWTVDQLEYMHWLATPSLLRSPPTVSALAAQLGHERSTLWRWSRLAGFGLAVAELAAEHVKSHQLADIYAGQVALASSDHPASTAAARFVFEAIGLLGSGSRLTVVAQAGVGVGVRLDDLPSGDVAALLALASAELGAVTDGR
jgi:hypothetical protein